jgi:hypothetical protein
MHSLVDATDDRTDTGLCCRSTRLDEDLYLHLSRFEFLHFAGAHSEVLDFARPPSTIAPIKEEIVAALGTLSAKESSYIDITLDSFLLSGIPDLAEENADLFLDLLDSSLGFRPNDSNYERSVALASELMYRVRLFSSVAPTPRESVKVSFRNIVTALCATSQALRFPTHYRPRVFGDDSQTRSIITPLECPIELDGVTQPCEFAEGHLQIWHNRREWVQDALEGNNDIAELKFSLRRILWTKVVECVKPNNVDAIAENLSRLEARLLRVRPQALGA